MGTGEYTQWRVLWNPQQFHFVQLLFECACELLKVAMDESGLFSVDKSQEKSCVIDSSDEVLSSVGSSTESKLAKNLADVLSDSFEVLPFLLKILEVREEFLYEH